MHFLFSHFHVFSFVFIYFRSTSCGGSEYFFFFFRVELLFTGLCGLQAWWSNVGFFIYTYIYIPIINSSGIERNARLYNGVVRKKKQDTPVFFSFFFSSPLLEDGYLTKETGAKIGRLFFFLFFVYMWWFVFFFFYCPSQSSFLFFFFSPPPPPFVCVCFFFLFFFFLSALWCTNGVGVRMCRLVHSCLQAFPFCLFIC